MTRTTSAFLILSLICTLSGYQYGKHVAMEESWKVLKSVVQMKQKLYYKEKK